MKYSLFYLLFFALVASSQAQDQVSLVPANNSESNKILQKKVEKVDSIVMALYESNQFNGTIAIVYQGQPIYKNALGWANFEKKDTLKVYTPFRIASVSKQFTSMAIMMLKEKGKLLYDDDIRMYLPEIPYEGITIKNLLHHNSGITDYFALDGTFRSMYGNKCMNNEDMLNYYSKNKPRLQFKSGTQSQYSNTGYVFLALIVERITGKKFPQFIQENIFTPLKMNTAYVYDNKKNQVLDTFLISEKTVKVDTVLKGNKKEIIKTTVEKTSSEPKLINRAWGYEFDGAANWSSQDWDVYDEMYGEKDVCLSVEDMLKWDKALHTDKLVSYKTLKEAFTHNDMMLGDYGFGYGWKIPNDQRHKVFHHGLYNGFRTFFQRNLSDKTSIVIFTNRSIGQKMYDIYRAIEHALYDEPYEFPSPTYLESIGLEKFKNNYRISYSSLQDQN